MDIKIRKTGPENDSDDVEFTKDGKSIGFGFKSKETGKICLIRCPLCGRENYSMVVSSGDCAWCGYNAN